MGIGSYGAAFTLADPGQNWPGSPVTGGGHLDYRDVSFINHYHVIIMKIKFFISTFRFVNVLIKDGIATGTNQQHVHMPLVDMIGLVMMMLILSLLR